MGRIQRSGGVGSGTVDRVTPLVEPELDRDVPIPPANTEAEQALLGAILINNAAYGRVAEFLAPEHFSNKVHGRIYAACGKLIEQGVIANPITLKNLFDQDAALVEIGGAQYLGRLAEAAVTIINAEHYGRTIHDLHLRRALITVGQDVVTDAFSHDLDDSAPEQIARAEQKLFELGSASTTRGHARPVGDFARESMSQSEAAYKADGKMVGIPTGLIDLDKKLGGLQAGNLELIAGRPSMGKSSLAANILVCVGRNEIPCAAFSLEETGAQQARRLITLISGVAGERQRRGELDMIQWDRMESATGHLSALSIHLDDTPGLTVSDIRRRARDLKRRHNIQLVTVDHIQLIRSTLRTDNRTAQVGDITRSLKELAKELDIPVVALCQLSRGVEQRDNKRPMLSDLRESGSIEEDADRVIFVFREEYYLERSEPSRRADEAEDKFNDRYGRWRERCEAVHAVAELIIAKNRMGPIGTAMAHWDAEMTEFSNYIGPEHLPQSY